MNMQEFVRTYHVPYETDIDQMMGDLLTVIAAAVAAEHQRTLEQAAKIRLPVANTSDVLGWSDMTAEEKRMWHAGRFTGICEYQDSILTLT